MKVEIKESKQTPKFPALYRNTGNRSLVVLATDSHTGAVVAVGSTGWSLGESYDASPNFDDAYEWERLPPGTAITLIQE